MPLSRMSSWLEVAEPRDCKLRSGRNRPERVLKRARESVHKLRKSAVINIWLDPREYAPGTKNQTMYK
jgi:hypothetical protein